jgi:hypothetical protein
MRFAIAIVITSVLAGPAVADKQITTLLERHLAKMMSGSDPLDGPGPRFAFTEATAHVSPATIDDARNALPDYVIAKNVVVIAGADSSTAWIGADLAQHMVCGMVECQNAPPDGWFHATALYQLGPTPAPIAWHIADTVTAKEQAAAIKKGATLALLARQIDAGAEDVVKLFESTIGDPKALAKTIADHKNALLYGSELAERTVGGKKVAAKLGAWKLSFKVRDGIQAGVTKNKMTGWVAANVDATSQKKPKDKPVPYRVLAIYVKYTGGWMIEALHFSYVPYSFRGG